MKTLQLRNGDLVVTGRTYDEVSGGAKVTQDLRGALAEPLGNDRFHPGWGSTLDDHVARTQDENTRFEIRAEVNRVISNYASVQRDRVEADIHSGRSSRYSASEILQSVISVDVALAEDRASVKIRLQTASGETIALTEDSIR